MGEKLTAAELEFLKRVLNGDRPGVADRKADKVRQRCRRNGLARWQNGAWHITQEGRAALAREEGR